jgi:Fic family protein
MERALERATANEVTVADILAIHEALLANTPDAGIAGTIRQSQNWIGGSNPTRAAFVPPPANLVGDLLDDLARFANRDDLPAFLQAAIVHAQFETIHPFADGNGRVGRALVPMILARRDLSATVPIPVSLALASDTNHYVNGLTDYRYGEIDDWLAFFLTAAGRAAGGALLLTNEIDELQQRWTIAAGHPRASSAAARILKELVTLPVFTVASMATHLRVSRRSVETAVQTLEDAGVIARTTIGKRNRIFKTVGLFALLATLERDLSPPGRAPHPTHSRRSRQPLNP